MHTIQPLPLPHKQFWTSVVSVGGGGGRTARKFRKGCTVLRGNREMTEKYEY